MKKNKMMRLASLLLVAVLLTTSVIGGTFAKYVTTAEGSDSARVARWGFEGNTIEIDDLFAAAYDGTVASANGTDKVIAPGTKGSTTISFVPAKGTPEVDYSIAVSATTNADTATNTIIKNENITWALYKSGEEASANWGSFSELLTSINGLSQTTVEANSLPTLNDTYVIAWNWEFYTDADADVVDTGMGNAATLETIDLTISITATQID